MRSSGKHGLSLHEKVVALKQRQRDGDGRALKEGRLSAQEINRKNAAFGPDFAKLPLDFDTIASRRMKVFATVVGIPASGYAVVGTPVELHGTLSDGSASSSSAARSAKNRSQKAIRSPGSGSSQNPSEYLRPNSASPMSFTT